MTAEEIYNFVDEVYKNGTLLGEYVNVVVSGHIINCRKIHDYENIYSSSISNNAYHMVVGVSSNIKFKHSVKIIKLDEEYLIADIEQDDNPVTNPLGNNFKNMSVENFFELWKPLMREIKLNKIIDENI